MVSGTQIPWLHDDEAAAPDASKLSQGLTGGLTDDVGQPASFLNCSSAPICSQASKWVNPHGPENKHPL